MLRFPFFNHTIFYGIREITGVLYLAAQERFTKGKDTQFPASLFDQEIPFKTVERCINHRRVKPACSNQTLGRDGRFLYKKVINHPVCILFFHLYSFLMVVNKGFAVLLKKKRIFRDIFF